MRRERQFYAPYINLTSFVQLVIKNGNYTIESYFIFAINTSLLDYYKKNNST